MGRRLLGGFLVVVLLAGVLAGAATAGDGSVVIYPDENEQVQTVAPGGEVEITLLVGFHGLYDEGLENVTVVGSYNDSLLSVADVELASWFETDGTEREVVTETQTGEPGSLTVTQELVSGDGVAHTDRFVTLTFDVAADAPPSNTTLDLESSRVVVDGGFPFSVYAQPSHADGPNGPQIVIEESADGGGSDDDGAVPVPVALVAVCLAAGLGVMRRRLR